MKKHIDTRGLASHEPVVRARQVMLRDDADQIVVVVDDEASAENIQQMAAAEGWSSSVAKSADEMHVTLVRASYASAKNTGPVKVETPLPPTPKKIDMAVFISSNALGVGDDELGKILLRAFLKTLVDIDPRPQTIIFINSGVRLTTTKAEVLDDLRALEALGVRILSCGTSLDFYRIKGNPLVGKVSNMFEIISVLCKADSILRP